MGNILLPSYQVFYFTFEDAVGSKQGKVTFPFPPSFVGLFVVWFWGFLLHLEHMEEEAVVEMLVWFYLFRSGFRTNF